MTDVVDRVTRSRMMSGIRGKNTKPERLIRSGLHKRGLRFRLQSAVLIGRPDIVLPKYRVAIFIHGCFWHGHDCRFFKWPSTRREFWRDKILGNQTRDRKVAAEFTKGWRRLVIWECAIRGIAPDNREQMLDRVAAWIANSKERFREIRGK